MTKKATKKVLPAEISNLVKTAHVDKYLDNEDAAKNTSVFEDVRALAIALPDSFLKTRNVWSTLADDLALAINTSVEAHGKTRATWANNVSASKMALVSLLFQRAKGVDLESEELSTDLMRTAKDGRSKVTASLKAKTVASRITGFPKPKKAKKSTPTPKAPNPSKLGQAELDEIVATKAELMTEAIAHANELVSKGEIKPAPLKQALTALAIASREYYDAVVEGQAK